MVTQVARHRTILQSADTADLNLELPQSLNADVEVWLGKRCFREFDAKPVRDAEGCAAQRPSS